MSKIKELAKLCLEQIEKKRNIFTDKNEIESTKLLKTIAENDLNTDADIIQAFKTQIKRITPSTLLGSYKNYFSNFLTLAIQFVNSAEKILSNENYNHNKTQSDLAKLPDDIILYALSFLNKKVLARASQSSRYLRDFTQHTLFKHMPMPELDYRKPLKKPELIESGFAGMEWSAADQQRFGITSLVVLDHKQVLCGTAGGYLRLWDIERKEWIKTVYSADTEPLPITLLCVVSNRYVICALEIDSICNLQVRIWDIKNWKYKQSFDHAGLAKLAAIAALADNRIVTLFIHKKIDLCTWNIETGERLVTFNNDLLLQVNGILPKDCMPGMYNGVLAVLKNGHIAMSYNKKIYIWNPDDGKLIKILSVIDNKLELYSNAQPLNGKGWQGDGWLERISVLDNGNLIYASDKIYILDADQEKCIKSIKTPINTPSFHFPSIIPLSNKHIIINFSSIRNTNYVDTSPLILDIINDKWVFIEKPYEIDKRELKTKNSIAVDGSKIFHAMDFIKFPNGNFIGYNCYRLSMWTFPELSLQNKLENRNELAPSNEGNKSSVRYSNNNNNGSSDSRVTERISPSAGSQNCT